MTRKEAFSDEPIEAEVFEGDFGNTPLDYLKEFTSPQEVKVIQKEKKPLKTKASISKKERELDYFTEEGKISVQFLAKEGAAFLDVASTFLGKMVRNFKREVSKNDDGVGGKRAG